MIEVFVDQQSLGIKDALKEVGIIVHDDSEIRGTNDTRIGVSDDTILEYLAAHKEQRLVTKDRLLGKRAADLGLRVTFVDESEAVAREVIRRLALSSLEVRRRFGAAMARFLRHDSILLILDANERSITHKLAEYLQDEFREWEVDCEYNRIRAEPKSMDLPKNGVDWDDVEGRTVFPDIIIHRRAVASNLLVIEVKKSTSSIPDSLDQEKLRQFGSNPYFYENRLFLRIYAGKEAGRAPQTNWL